MSLESSFKILYDVNGNPLALSQSQTISSSQSALLLAGSSSTGQLTFLQTTNDGKLFVTGNLSAVVTSSVVFPNSQSVKLVATSGTFITSSFASTTAYQILPANMNRKVITFYVEGRRNFFIGFGYVPTINLFTAKLIPGSYLESPENYTGNVWIISTNNDLTSFINVTEFLYP